MSCREGGAVMVGAISILLIHPEMMTLAICLGGCVAV
jgi:hypothetical protein